MSRVLASRPPPPPLESGMSWKTEWDSGDVLKLIKLYEERPVLWNKKHGGANKKVNKDRAWAFIGRRVGVHPADARRKMDSLLSSFRRERRRIKKITEDEVDKKKRWFAYNSLRFLLDKDEHPENEVDDSETESSPKKKNRRVSRDSEEDTEEEEDAPKETQQHTESTLNQTSSNSNVASSSVVPIFSTPQPRDECAPYGEHVANKLRGYSKRTQAIVQFHFNNILFQADINGFESTTELAIDTRSAVLLDRRLGTNGEASTSGQ